MVWCSGSLPEFLRTVWCQRRACWHARPVPCDPPHGLYLIFSPWPCHCVTLWYPVCLLAVPLGTWNRSRPPHVLMTSRYPMVAPKAFIRDVKNMGFLGAGASTRQVSRRAFYFWHFWQRDLLLEFNKTRQRLSPRSLAQRCATSSESAC